MTETEGLPVTGNVDVDAVLSKLAGLDGSAGERLVVLSQAQDELARVLENSRSMEIPLENGANAA